MVLVHQELVLRAALLATVSGYFISLDAHAEECFFRRVTSGTKMGLIFEKSRTIFKIPLEITVMASLLPVFIPYPLYPGLFLEAVTSFITVTSALERHSDWGAFFGKRVIFRLMVKGYGSSWQKKNQDNSYFTLFSLYLAVLHLNIRTLTDDMLDRFASIRIPGSKKERTPLSNLKTAFSSNDCSSEMNENIPKPLSEKELLELFEKMMRKPLTFPLSRLLHLKPPGQAVVVAVLGAVVVAVLEAMLGAVVVAVLGALEDMNLNEEKKAPLREKDFSTKKEMVMQYINTASKTGSVKSSRQISPQEFIHELKMGSADERLFTCLESLRVSLTSNPVSWVESFEHEGLGLLLDILEKLISGKIQEKIIKKNQHKVIQCLKALMNTQYGLERIMSEERSLSLLARAIDPEKPSMMTDVVKLLSAMCIVGEESILEEVLEALTSAGEERKIDRFSSIVEGLRHNSVQLQPDAPGVVSVYTKVACMQLINALVTSPDDLDFRLHIRNEFMRCGLKEILPNLKRIKNDGLDIQLKVFDEHKEEDLIEFFHRLEDIRAELEYPFVLKSNQICKITAKP
ncbi:hypothetical protein E2I00_014412 [Balaenoptera physalus]|uniref:GBD/FH3 domain-containing protein n=1 Tax=Balaenoptera physalus TaxID=9770 RepID=A0A6A1Q7W3_BALPH|nr:hypothetical protein E2I00_014412 [Balaenoptera physalus]